MIIHDLQAEHQVFPVELRTPPLFSVPGSIAASFGFGIDDLPDLFGGRTEGHGYMMTKWRTPVPLLNDLQPAVNVATAVAKNWRMDDLPEGETDFPGCLISARAIIHASAHSYDFAVELYQDMLALRPKGWEKNIKARVAIMARYQAHMPTHAVRAIDHPTIEGALCRMAGFKPGSLVKAGVGKRRALDLANGRSSWRQEEIDGALLPALAGLATTLQEAIPYALDYDEEHLDAMAGLSPALAATVWQMWPSLRNEIEIASPWFSVHRPGL